MRLHKKKKRQKNDEIREAMSKKQQQIDDLENAEGSQEKIANGKES